MRIDIPFYIQIIIQFLILINSIRIAGYSILGAFYAEIKNYVPGERGEAEGSDWFTWAISPMAKWHLG